MSPRPGKRKAAPRSNTVGKSRTPTRNVRDTTLTTGCLWRPEPNLNRADMCVLGLARGSGPVEPRRGTDVAVDAQSPHARESPANKYGSQTGRLPIPRKMKQAHGRLPVGLEI